MPDLRDPYLPSDNVEDYFEQIGLNTSYNIHPEETLADNFVLLMTKKPGWNSPRVVNRLRQVINDPPSALLSLPAGRFRSTLRAVPGPMQIIEISNDLESWSVWDCVTNNAATIELIDADAWFVQHRSFRVRPTEVALLVPGDTNNMVWIEPGSFLMCCPVTEVGRYTNEAPQRLVTISRGFRLGRYEVTQGEYQQVMGGNPSSFQSSSVHPVEQVTWHEAANYCARLTELEHAAGRLVAGWAYRLPTEAEWEYAARAGTTNRYDFGDDPDWTEVYRFASFMDSRLNRGSRPVAAKPPNGWGLYGIYGNVGEWCSDWYAKYPVGDVTNPQGPTSGTNRVWRGGGFFLRARDCRCACRNQADPEERQPHVGFRIALAPGIL